MGLKPGHYWEHLWGNTLGSLGTYWELEGNMKCDMDAYVASKGNSKVRGAEVVTSVGQIWHFRPVHRICIGHILFLKKIEDMHPNISNFFL
jgi:hypothetical protein